MNGLFYLIILGVVISLVLAVWGFTSLAVGQSDQRRLAARGLLDDAERQANGPLVKLDARLRRTDLGRRAALRIAASGVRIRVSTAFLIIAVAGLLAMFIIGEFLGIIMGVVAAVAVGMAFFSYLRRQEARRRDEFINQLPELARVLSNATSAGLAIRTAVGMAAEELGDPAGTELRRTADSLAFGQSFEDAMNDLQERLPSRELGVLISTLVVSSRSGGSLVTALRTISTTLEERKETRRETQTILGEAVATGWALAFMGFGSIFLLNVVQHGSIKHMSGILIGQIILIVSVGLFSAGLYLIRRMTRIDI